MAKPDRSLLFAIFAVLFGVAWAGGADAAQFETARNVVLTDTLPEDVQMLDVTVDGVSVTPAFVPGTRQFSIDLGARRRTDGKRRADRAAERSPLPGCRPR